MVELKDFNQGKITWCPGCLLPGSIIWGNPTVKKIEEFKEGEKVLGLDGRYHRIVKTFKHKYKGKLYKITTKCFGETVLTPEHPILIAKRKKNGLKNKKFNLEWLEAEAIEEGDYAAYPIVKDVADYEYIDLPVERKLMDRKSYLKVTKVKLDKDFLKLVGFYIAEGYVHDREITFTFGITEMNYVKEVVRLTKKIFGLKATYRIRKEKNQIDVGISSSILGRIFNGWFGNGAEHKKLPSFVMLLPKEKQVHLIRGMWYGDGWAKNGQYRSTYKTISKTLVEQLKFLLIRQGIVPSIHTNKAYDIHRESYGLFVTDSRDLKKLSKILNKTFKIRNSRSRNIAFDEKYVYLPVRKIETFDYFGDVYNFGVADVESYVTNNLIVHNCGNFSLLNAIKRAFVELNLEPYQIAFTSGIGCFGKESYWTKSYGFSGLHGRELPLALGAKLTNRELAVFVAGGDGNTFGEGVNHFIHTARKNVDITVIVHDNQVYGLTTGQKSPTSEKGFVTISSPKGVVEDPLNPMTLALSSGATFIARSFAGDMEHTTKMIVEGIKHKGFSFIDIFQPCVTYNYLNTYDYWKKRCYDLQKKKYDFTNREKAFKKMHEYGDKIPVGVFYKVDKPSYEELFPQTKVPLYKHNIESIDVNKLLDEFK